MENIQPTAVVIAFYHKYPHHVMEGLFDRVRNLNSVIFVVKESDVPSSNSNALVTYTSAYLRGLNIYWVQDF